MKHNNSSISNLMENSTDLFIGDDVVVATMTLLEATVTESMADFMRYPAPTLS